MESEIINGKHEFIPKEIKNHYLHQVKCGSSMIDSETQNIIPILISRNDEQIIFCDTPGFNDTRGSEVDIANGIGIRRCAEVCEGLKPIVIISSQVGDRAEILVKLAEILNSMFSNLQSAIRDFIYIYTKFPIDHKEAKIKLNELLNSLDASLNNQEKSREGISNCFKILVRDMFRKSKRDLIFIDPINGDKEEALDLIINNQAEFITNIEEKISGSLSKKSEKKLESQFDKHYKAMEKSIELFESELSMYKFKQLKELKDILRKKDINNKFDAILKKLIENFDKSCSKINQEFNKKIKTFYSLSEQEIENYFSFMKNIQDSNRLFKMFDIDETEKIENSYEEMKSDLKKNYATIFKTLCEKNLTENVEVIAISLSNLQKMSLLYENFQFEDDNPLNLAHLYNEMKRIISQTTASHFSMLSAISDILDSDDHDLNEICNQLDSVKKFEELFRNHLDENSFKYNEFKKVLLNAVEKKIKMFNEIFVKNDDEEKVLENLEAFESKIKEYDFLLKFFDRSVMCLQSHLDHRTLEENKMKLLEKATVFFDFIHEIIRDKLKFLGENDNRYFF
jgi:hypothetical protein